MWKFAAKTVSSTPSWKHCSFFLELTILYDSVVGGLKYMVMFNLKNWMMMMMMMMIPIDEHMFQIGEKTTKAVLFGFI